MEERSPRIGLTLGSGGIKGCAHIGVLKVLTEEKIPIYCICGASAGAIIALGYAGGLSPWEMEDAFLKIKPVEFLSFYIDRFRIRSDTAIGQKVLSLGGDIQLGSLPLRCAVTAVDLDRKERVVITEGPAVEAVMAAIAIPFITPPVKIQGRNLYDGGLINSVPVDVAYHLGAEKVIAVDVEEGRPLPVRALVLFWRILRPLLGRVRGRGSPGSGRLVSLLDILSRPEPLWGKSPDILLRPLLRGIGPNSFWKVREAIHEGERAAREALPHIRAL